MEAYRTDAVVKEDGTVTIGGLPFRTGERLEVILLQTAGRSNLELRRGDLGKDLICGLGGNYRIDGRGGDDVIGGGLGKDTLVGGPGRDRLFGDAGNDNLNTRDGKRGDLANGGSGRDRCTTDRGDKRVSCEVG